MADPRGAIFFEKTMKAVRLKARRFNHSMLRIIFYLFFSNFVSNAHIIKVGPIQYLLSIFFSGGL
jgi:hypothetical protein